MQCTVWKNEKFTVTEKKNRQIKSLVISLGKPLFSRNFSQKFATVNFHNFHIFGVWNGCTYLYLIGPGAKPP